jgi:hypothetical protein
MLSDCLFKVQETQISMTFNLINTNISKNIDIDINMRVNDFINYVSANVRYDFGINDNYKIEIVNVDVDEYSISLLMREPDYAPALKPSNLTLYEVIGKKIFENNVFYIRPTLGLRVNLNSIESVSKKKVDELDSNVPKCPVAKEYYV